MAEYHDDEARQWHTIAETCWSKRPLYPNESRFVEAMVHQTLYGRVPSERQQSWLSKIWHRPEGEPWE